MTRVVFCFRSVAIGGLELYALDLLHRLDRSRVAPIVYFYSGDAFIRSKIQEELRSLQIPLRWLNQDGWLGGEATTEPQKLQDQTQGAIRDSRRIGRNGAKTMLLSWLPHWIRRAVWYWKGATQTSRVIRRDTPDVIHVIHACYPSLEIPIFASWLAGVRVRISDILVDPTDMRSSGLFARLVTRLMVFTVTSVCVMSRTMASLFSRYCGGASNKVRIIYRGVNPPPAALINGEAAEVRKRLGIPSHARVIVTIARLSPEKGHRFLIQAASELAVRYPHARYLFIGDGPSRQELEQTANDSCAAKQIAFLGFRSDAAGLLCTADLFVLPSLAEGAPFAILEAMAVGKPIVASDVGFMRELFGNREMGRIVAPGNVQELRVTLDEFLSADDATLHRVGQAARQRFGEFPTRQESAEQVFRLYGDRQPPQ